MGCFRRCWSFRHQAITVPSLFAVYRWWPSQENVRLQRKKKIPFVQHGSANCMSTLGTTQGSVWRRGDAFTEAEGPRTGAPAAPSVSCDSHAGRGPAAAFVKLLLTQRHRAAQGGISTQGPAPATLSFHTFLFLLIHPLLLKQQLLGYRKL